MKASELREKSEAELREQLMSLLKKQFNHRMQKVTGEFRTNHLFGEVRRDIARVRTILREKVARA